MSRRPARSSQTSDQKTGPAVVAKPDPKPVLLATERDAQQVGAILSAYHLHDIDQADRNLQSMAGEPHHRRQLADILPVLLDSIEIGRAHV